MSRCGCVSCCCCALSLPRVNLVRTCSQSMFLLFACRRSKRASCARARMCFIFSSLSRAHVFAQSMFLWFRVAIRNARLSSCARVRAIAISASIGSSICQGIRFGVFLRWCSERMRPGNRVRARGVSVFCLFLQLIIVRWWSGLFNLVALPTTVSNALSNEPVLGILLGPPMPACNAPFT